MPRRYHRTAGEVGLRYWRATRTSVRRDCQSGMADGLIEGSRSVRISFDWLGPRDATALETLNSGASDSASTERTAMRMFNPVSSLAE